MDGFEDTESMAREACAGMTDREILVAIYGDIAQIKRMGNVMVERLDPMLDGLTKSPIGRMLGL